MRNKLLIYLFTFTVISTNAFSQTPQSMETDFKNFVASPGTGYGGTLPKFMISEGTVGTRYLFDHWVKGTVTNLQGITYNAPNVVYNYDKVREKLMAYVDNTTVIEINTKDVSSFTISDGNAKYMFDQLTTPAAISFYQPVAKTNGGYSLYKLLTTKFKRADFETNGLIEKGNRYDEYKDEYQYFIFSPKKELIEIPLKEKAIKKALEENKINADEFFSKHKSDKVDEDFLQSLIQFLNSKKS